MTTTLCCVLALLWVAAWTSEGVDVDAAWAKCHSDDECQDASNGRERCTNGLCYAEEEKTRALDWQWLLPALPLVLLLCGGYLVYRVCTPVVAPIKAKRGSVKVK